MSASSHQNITPPPPRTVSKGVLKTQKRAHEIDARERERQDDFQQQQFRESSAMNFNPSTSFNTGGGGGSISNNNNNNNNLIIDNHRHHHVHSSAFESSSNFKNNNNNNIKKEQRFIPLCHSEDSKEEKAKDKLELFRDNSISTSRYSLSPWKLNFIIWKNLFEQFHRRANWFFVCVGILELVPQLEALSAVTLVTLTVVLLLGMFRSLVEDLKRQAADRVMNNQGVLVIKNFKDREWRTVKSMDVAVGDIVLLEASAKNASEAIPCDLVLLSTSEPDDTCAVQSAHIDGEAKWTMKRCLPCTKIPTLDGKKMMDGDELGENFVGQVTQMFEGMTITCDKPDGNIHSFDGSINMRSSLTNFPVKIPQLLLRGTQLRKAKWVVGVCVYTGNETKALKDHELPTRKWSRIEKVVNTLILVSLFFYFLVVIGTTVAFAEVSLQRNRWYLPKDKTKTEADEVTITLFSFIIFFSNAIPISLYVTLEIIELVAAFLIEEDLAMYDSTLDRRTTVRAPELLPDLGQISYLFSDKTGTITRNELSLRKFSVRGEIYGTGITEIGRAVAKHRGEKDPAGGENNNSAAKRRRSSVAATNNNNNNNNSNSKSENNNNSNNNSRRPSSVNPNNSRRRSSVAAENMMNGDEQELEEEIDSEMTPFYDPRFDEDTWFRHVDGPRLEKLFTAMAVCHTTNISTKYLKQKRKSKNVSRLSQVKKYDGESPDECALCETARKFGVEFIERKGDTVIVENRNGSRIPYIIRDVLPFTSERMRMSALIELPNGQFKLICKGADSAIFPLAVDDDNSRKESLAASQLSAEGLRTLVFAERKLSKKFVEEWLRKDDAVKNAGDFYFESATNARKNLASEIEKDLSIIGVSGMEDMLQHGVPDAMKALRAANIKIWVVTGDSREAAINIGYSSGMVPVEAHLLELYGISKENIDEFRLQVENPIVPGAELASELSRGASMASISKLNKSASGRLDVEHADPKIRDSHNDMISALRRSSSFQGGRKNSSAPPSPNAQSQQKQGGGGTVSSSGEIPLLSSSVSTARPSNSPPRYDDNNNNTSTTPKTFVAIIDGTTFSTILESDEKFQLEAFRALEKCSSVICSRFSSSQKAKIVNFMTHWLEKMDHKNVLTAGIGDGTNDIPMLRATSVGIGMFGVENFDAANAGDFAISQFWFLQRLLLNHGRSSYRRFALVIKYFLYKNLLFVGMLFFFAVQSDWTPQAYLSSQLLGLYNILFTSVPIIVAGIADRDIFRTDDLTKHFPELYADGQTNEHLNLRGLLPWVANAISHAIICYFICVRMYEPINNDGITMGGDATAITVYTCVVVVASVQLGFHITSYTTLMVAAFWASVIFGYFWYVMLFSATPPSTSGNSYRSFENVGFQLQPWFLAFLAVQLCSAREAFTNYAVFNFYPFDLMPLRRIIQLADSSASRENSIAEPYELGVLARRENFYKKRNVGAIAATTQLLASTSLSAFTDKQVNDRLNALLQFKDGETEENFLISFFGKLTRYKVGGLIACVFSGGIAIISALNYASDSANKVSILETIGWSLFFLVSVMLVIIFFTQDYHKVRPLLHQIMLVALLVAFSGMSIANFVASQREPDTHPVTMAVSVFGLLVVVRPPLIQILQYLTIAVTGLILWYQVFRVEAWEMPDIFLRVIEFVIVFLISLIGLVIGEKFDRKLYLMKLAIEKSVELSTEAEKRSRVLLNNVLPASIVAEMSNRRIHRNLTDFSVTLPNASVLQSDIVSFTAFSSSKQPHQVVEMLNLMFKKFDYHVNDLGIEKIKTIGDAYVVASGIPCTDSYHAEKICCFGLRMLTSISEMNEEGVPSIPDLNIAVRVGAACGPIKAGVIAMEKMRYELFGGTAEDCEKMEQTGKPGRVQVTKALYSVTKGSFNYDVIYDEEASKDRYFLREDSVEPYLRGVPASQLVSTNTKKLPDRFRILDDEDPTRSEILKKQDPTTAGKLNRYSLKMRSDDLEQEFREYYSLLADDRTNVETAQSTIMYALVASIVALFVGTANNPIVILQIVIASLLGTVTFLRTGVPFIKTCRYRLKHQWQVFEAQVVSGGLSQDQDDLSDSSSFGSQQQAMNNNNASAKESRRSSGESGSNNSFGRHQSSGNAGGEGVEMRERAVSTSFENNNNNNNASDPLLEKSDRQHTGCNRVLEILSQPKTTVLIVGILTLADPIIVLSAIDVDGIGRGSVFITLAAASFIFSQMHLFFLQKIALASLHFVAVSIAFFVRTAHYQSFDGFRDGGDYVGVLCCYVLCIGAAYTTERSVRKAFVAQKNVERRNAEIGTTLHLCEKLLANSIPASIVRRLQEAPDRAVVDEIPEASVLFLYIDGVFPHGEEAEAEEKRKKGIEKDVFGDIPWAEGDDAMADEIGTEAGMMNPTPTSRLGVTANDDTPDVVSRMNDVYYVLDALCRYHQVEKIKTLPYLVVSGCPEPIPKHCYRLACVARDAIVYAAAYNARNAGKLGSNGKPIAPLQIKAGLHSGRVTAGILGTSKFVYDIFGDTVNLSSRLASNGKWGQVSCSEAAKKFLALESVTVTSRGEVFLKGKGNVPVFEIDPPSVRIPTPDLIHDINAHLETIKISTLNNNNSSGGPSRKDPHTARWSMKSSAARHGSDLGSLKHNANSSIDSSMMSPFVSQGHLFGNNNSITSNNGSNLNVLGNYVFPTSNRNSMAGEAFGRHMGSDTASSKSNKSGGSHKNTNFGRTALEDSPGTSNYASAHSVLNNTNNSSSQSATNNGGSVNKNNNNSNNKSQQALQANVFGSIALTTSFNDKDSLFDSEPGTPKKNVLPPPSAKASNTGNSGTSLNSSITSFSNNNINNNNNNSKKNEIEDDVLFKDFVSNNSNNNNSKVTPLTNIVNNKNDHQRRSGSISTAGVDSDDSDDILFGPSAPTTTTKRDTNPHSSQQLLQKPGSSANLDNSSNPPPPSNNRRGTLAPPEVVVPQRDTKTSRAGSTNTIPAPHDEKHHHSNSSGKKNNNKKPNYDPIFDSSSSGDDSDDSLLFGPSAPSSSSKAAQKQQNNPMSQAVLIGDGAASSPSVPAALKQNPKYADHFQHVVAPHQQSRTNNNNTNKKNVRNYDPFDTSDDDDDKSDQNHIIHQQQHRPGAGAVAASTTTSPTAPGFQNNESFADSVFSASNGVTSNNNSNNTPQTATVSPLQEVSQNNNNNNHHSVGIHSPTSPSIHVAKNTTNLSVAIGNAPSSSSGKTVTRFGTAGNGNAVVDLDAGFFDSDTDDDIL